MKWNTGDILNRKEFLIRTGGVIGAGLAGMSFSFGLNTYAEEKSAFRILGRTGLEVSGVGYGTTLTDVTDVLKKVVDTGINFIDTGRMYANGKNEEMIGRVLQTVRKNLIIQTKFHRKFKNDKKAIEKSIDDSLKALRTDYIDIMLLHAASSAEELNAPEIYEALTKARKEGKIRYTGFSSHSNQVEMLRIAEKSKFYDVAMIAYNHAGNFRHTVYEGFYQEWDQDALEKEIKNAAELGMGIVAMKTCSTAPHKEKRGPKGSYPDGLKWVLRNRNISTMAVWMDTFGEVDENVRAMRE